MHALHHQQANPGLGAVHDRLHVCRLNHSTSPQSWYALPNTAWVSSVKESSDEQRSAASSWVEARPILPCAVGAEANISWAVLELLHC